MGNKTAEKYQSKLLRHNRELQMVKLGLTKVSDRAQRAVRQAWVDELVANFDIDQVGTPEVSFRDGHYYIMDGQHRIEACKAWLGKGWEEQHLQCWVANGLTEEEEAEIFLRLQSRKAVDKFDEFKVALRAGRQMASDIQKLVIAAGLCISKGRTVPGAVCAVGTLEKVYKRNGSQSLLRALVLAKESYGDPGLDAPVIDGFGMLCHRYNGILDESTAVQALNGIHGGVSGLLGTAEMLRQKTGSSKAQCIAATAVTVINRHRTGKKKLPSWFKE